MDVRDILLSPTLAADLPDDVLWEVWLYNAVDPSAKQMDRAFTTRSCSQVCRSWRQSALRCGKLWASTISYENDRLSWMEELLKRSASSPLTIADFGRPLMWKFHSKGESVRLRENLLLRHKQRWRHVSIHGIPEEEADMRLVPDYLLIAAPNIQSLKLKKFQRSRIYYPIRGLLFADHAPSLRSLDLDGVQIDFDALHNIAGQLEELSISWDDSQSIRGIPKPKPFTEWVNFLRRTPRLRNLFLHRTTADSNLEDQISIKAPEHILLNRLETVCLEVPNPKVAEAILGALVIPHNCGLVVYCAQFQPLVDQSVILQLIQERVQWWNTRSNYPRFLCAQQRRYRQQAWSAITNFKTPPTQYKVLSTVRACISDPVIRREIQSADPPVAVVLQTSNLWEAGTLEAILPLLATFEVPGPTTTLLRLDIPYGSSPALYQIMASALSTFRSVKTLELAKNYNLIFPAIKRLESNQLIFPFLETVSLIPDWSSNLDEKSIDLLASFLQWRRKQGHPVSTLDLTEIKDVAVNSEAFQVLAEVIDIFRW